jgi:hypothetical protein
VGFEPTIPTFELAKEVHAFDREATLIDLRALSNFKTLLRTNICTHALKHAFAFLGSQVCESGLHQAFPAARNSLLP